LPSKAPSAARSPATKRHHKEFEFGDRVRILDSGLHPEKEGEVVDLSFGSKESHFSLQVIVTVPHSQKFPILMKLSQFQALDQKIKQS
jgi:hypothetical protein